MGVGEQVGPSIRPRCDFFSTFPRVSHLCRDGHWVLQGCRVGLSPALTTDRVPCALVPTWGLHRAFRHYSDNGAWGSSLARDTGGQCLAVQRVPPLRAWSSVPPTGKKAPGWFLCPGVGTTGFQFVSRKSPFLGWEDGEKSRDCLGAEKGVRQDASGCVSLTGHST